MAETPKIKIVTQAKRVPFYFDPDPASSNLVGTVESIPPLSTSDPQHINIWFGWDEGLANGDIMELYLLAADLDNLPDIATARYTAVWSGVASYQVNSTGWAIQVIEHDQQFIMNSPKAVLDVEARKQNWGWVILSSNSDDYQLIMGQLTVEHSLEVRTWGNDNWTWNNIDEVKDGLTEVDTDVY